jgi:hypothetical protein
MLLIETDYTSSPLNVSWKKERVWWYRAIVHKAGKSFLANGIVCASERKKRLRILKRYIVPINTCLNICNGFLIKTHCALMRFLL